MIDIVIDSREKYKDYFAEKLSRWNIVIDDLEVGDFLIPGQTEEDAILIERKDDSDFLKSLEGKKDLSTELWTQGRLWSQLERMTKSGVGKLRLLVEGNIYSSRLTVYRKMGFDKKRIWGSLEGIAAWGVPVVYKKNRGESVEWLDFLIKRQNRPKKLYALRPSASKTMTLEEKKLYLLEGLPRVGPATARNILNAYPQSLLDAFNNAENWGEIKGIGSEMEREIKEILWTRNDKE